MSMVYPVNLNSQFNYPIDGNNRITRIAMACVRTEEYQQISPSDLPENEYNKNEDGTLSINIKSKTLNLKLFLDPKTKTAKTEDGKYFGKLKLEEIPEGRYIFDINTGKGQEKIEIFGTLDKFQKISFVCVTEYTVFAEKKKLSLLITALKRGEYISYNDRQGINRILRRLADKKMLYSLFEDFTALFKASKRPETAEYLISFMENSHLDDDTFDSLANRLLPFIGNEDKGYGLGITKYFRSAMAQGRSRRFIEKLVEKLESIINNRPQRDKIRAAMILSGIERAKPPKNRIYYNVPRVLKLILKVVQQADEKGQKEIIDDPEYFSHFFEIDRVSVHLVIDILEALLKNRPKTEYNRMASNILLIVYDADMKKVDAKGLGRLYKLIKPFTKEYWKGKELLGRIASHARAPQYLVKAIIKDLMNFAAEETDDKARLKIIQMLSDVPRTYKNIEYLHWKTIKSYEMLAKTGDRNTVKELVQKIEDLSYYASGITLPHLWKIAKILAHIQSRFPEDQEVLSDIASAYGTLLRNYLVDDEKPYLFYVHGKLKDLLRIKNKTKSFKQGLIIGFSGFLSNNMSSGKILNNGLKTLQVFLNDPDKEIRESAAENFEIIKSNYGISQKELKWARQILFDRLSIESESAVIKKILSSFSGIVQNENSNQKILKPIFRVTSPFLEDNNPDIRETAISILTCIAKNKNAGFQIINDIGFLLLFPLSGENQEIRKKAARSLKYIVNRYKNINPDIKAALSEYEKYGRYKLKNVSSIEETLKNLEHWAPWKRERAASNAKYFWVNEDFIKTDLKELKKLNSWKQLMAVLGALRISVWDSDYHVRKESKKSLKYAGFILEYKETNPKQDPILILPGSPEVPLSIDQKKRIEHNIFREFLVIPLSNTRDFTEEELSTIATGLQNIPYNLLGGFYSILADEIDYDREKPRALFGEEQIEFKGTEVTLSTLFHEIGHSIYKHILTVKQKALLEKLNEESKADPENYARGYGMEDIDEDFATMVEDWGNNSYALLNKALNQALAKKKPILLEKILIIAEAFAAGSPISNGYKITGNDIKRFYFKISRFNDGKLKTIRINNKTYHFVYGNDDRLIKINGKMVY